LFAKKEKSEGNSGKRWQHLYKWVVAIGFALIQGIQLRDVYFYFQSLGALTYFMMGSLIVLGLSMALISAVIVIHTLDEEIEGSASKRYGRYKRIWERIIVLASVSSSIVLALPFIIQANFIMAAILAAATFTVMDAMYTTELEMDSSSEHPNPFGDGPRLNRIVNGKESLEKNKLTRIGRMASVNVFLMNILVVLATAGVILFPVKLSFLNIIVGSLVLLIATSQSYFCCRKAIKAGFMFRFRQVPKYPIITGIDLIVSAAVAYFSYYAVGTHPFFSFGALTPVVATVVGLYTFAISLIFFSNFLIKITEHSISTKVEGGATEKTNIAGPRIHPKKVRDLRNRFFQAMIVFGSTIAIAQATHLPVLLMVMPCTMLFFLKNPQSDEDLLKVESSESEVASGSGAAAVVPPEFAAACARRLNPNDSYDEEEDCSQSESPPVLQSNLKLE
jgi:hypothetical protein